MNTPLEERAKQDLHIFWRLLILSALMAIVCIFTNCHPPNEGAWIGCEKGDWGYFKGDVTHTKVNSGCTEATLPLIPSFLDWYMEQDSDLRNSCEPKWILQPRAHPFEPSGIQWCESFLDIKIQTKGTGYHIEMHYDAMCIRPFKHCIAVVHADIEPAEE